MVQLPVKQGIQLSSPLAKEPMQLFRLQRLVGMQGSVAAYVSIITSIPIIPAAAYGVAFKIGGGGAAFTILARQMINTM